MELVLSARLSCIADFIPDGAVVADIGTDHAYLPIYLALHNRCPRIYACDVRDGPLQKARDYIAQYGVQDQIEVLKSDGFLNVPDDYSTAVIAGMGGVTIAEILSAANKRNGCQFLLQPMSKPEILRKFLYENHFYIRDEKVVRDPTGRLYTVMDTVFGQPCGYEPIDLFASAPLRSHRDALTTLYLERLLKIAEKQVQGIVKSNLPIEQKKQAEEHYLYLKKYFLKNRREIVDESQ